MNETRKCEVLVNGRWSELAFEDLKRGHLYRLFEDDGEAVDDGEICLALSDAYAQGDTWAVRSEAMGMVTNVDDAKFVKTICVDFDGVIHDYEGGWKGKAVVSGKPVAGAFAWLGQLLDDPDFEPVIYSSRSDDVEGIDAMVQWFTNHGFARVGELGFPTQKPPAWITLDDRAIRFTGQFPSLREMAEFRPWYK